MNRQVYIVVLFTLLILYFTGCQKPQDALNNPTNGNYPESTPFEVSGMPGTKLFEMCPRGQIKEDANAFDSSLMVFRYRLNLPDGCALYLKNSVFYSSEEEFQTAINSISQSSYYLSYKVEMEGAPSMRCVPQNSVWRKISEYQKDKTYHEQYERLDVPQDAPREILYLTGYPKPFPGHQVGIRKAFCN